MNKHALRKTTIKRVRWVGHRVWARGLGEAVEIQNDRDTRHRIRKTQCQIASDAKIITARLKESLEELTAAKAAGDELQAHVARQSAIAYSKTIAHLAEGLNRSNGELRKIHAREVARRRIQRDLRTVRRCDVNRNARGHRPIVRCADKKATAASLDDPEPEPERPRALRSSAGGVA